MASVVGAKGQIVIDRAIRRQLGIAPGWHAVQQLVGDKVVVEFVPPVHERSLCGVLAEYARGKPVLEQVDLADAADRDAAVEWEEKMPELGGLRMVSVASHSAR